VVLGVLQAFVVTAMIEMTDEGVDPLPEFALQVAMFLQNAVL